MDRVSFVDSLKGLGILSVILGHIASPFSSFIYLWHMPLFFMIGGFFINPDKPTLDFIKNNARNIMFAYFIFGALGIYVEYLKDLVLGRWGGVVELFGLLKGLFFYMDYWHLKNSYAFVLWFLPSLFFAKVFTFLLLKYIKILIIPYLSIIPCILFFDINLPFVIDIGFVASVFTLGGYFLFRWTKTKDSYLSILILGGLSLFCYFIFNYDIFTYRNFTWINHIFFTISFCVFLYFLSKKIKNPFIALCLNYLGRHSMFFYIFHVYTNNIANALLKNMHITHWIAIFILSLIMLFISSVILQNLRYFNKTKKYP